MSGYKRPSEDAVKKATGKGWEEWFELLDDSGMRDKPHKEIAQWLSDQNLIQSSWWCQSVTVAYEYHHGKRELGQTVDAGYQMGAQRTVDAPAEKVWQFLISKEGVRLWLGDTALTFQKGAKYETSDGTTGEIRSIDEGKKLRLTWQPPTKASSTIQIYLLPQNGKTSLSFHHEKLSGLKEREHMKRHWQQVLERIKESLIKK